MANIGYIGLGAMGSHMVDRLLEKGHSVTGYSRTRSKAEWLIEKRMKWADSPRDVGQAADVILSMVSNDSALMDVAEGPNGLISSLKANQFWVDMSTVSAATARPMNCGLSLFALSCSAKNCSCAITPSVRTRPGYRATAATL